MLTEIHDRIRRNLENQWGLLPGSIDITMYPFWSIKIVSPWLMLTLFSEKFSQLPKISYLNIN